jgi:uncharacterized protein YdaU (DUF1376 family)
MTRRRTQDGRVIFYAWCPADFNAKTSHLTDDARQAYRELLDFAFLHGRDQTDLPAHDSYLMRGARASQEEWPAIRSQLFEGPKPLFIATDDGYWRNPRLAEEVEIARIKSGKAKAASDVRWSKPEQTPPEQTPPPIVTEKKAKTPEVIPTELQSAANTYNAAAERLRLPRITDLKLTAIVKKARETRERIRLSIPDFTYAECVRRLIDQRERGSPFFRDAKFVNFEWLLKREHNGTQMNAEKIWNGNYRNDSSAPREATRERSSRDLGQRTAADILGGTER